MSSCETIRDCIESNPDVIQEIVNILIQETNTTYLPEPDRPGSPAPIWFEQTSLITSTIGGCDDDRLFGAAVYLVNQWSIRVEQFFEEVEQASNLLEFWQFALSLFPLTDISIGKLVEMANFIQELGTEAWAVADSPDRREEMACRIFCAFKSGCEPTFDEMFRAVTDHWDDLTGQNVDGIYDLIEFIDRLLSQLVWAGDVLFTGMFLIWLGLSRTIQQIPFGLGQPNGVRWFSERLTIGYSFSDPSWITICDNCAPSGTCPTQAINWETIATSGILDWENDPIPGLPASFFDFYETRWCNVHPANFTLRYSGYPTNGGVNGAVVSFAGYRFDTPCTLTSAAIDARFSQGLVTSKTQAIYVVTESWNWENAQILVQRTEIQASNTIGLTSWIGEVNNVIGVLFAATGRVEGAGNSGAPRHRVTNINTV